MFTKIAAYVIIKSQKNSGAQSKMGNHKKVNKGKNMNSKQINIAANIRNLRTGLGLSQDKLAQEFNVSVQAVSKWETGASMPDIMMLPKIADFFDISLDDLFYGAEEVQEPDLAVEQTNDEVYETENVTLTPDSSFETSSPEEPDISEDFEDYFRKFLRKDTIDYNNRESKFLRRLFRFENESSDTTIHVIRYSGGQYIESVYEDDTTVKLDFSDYQDNKINIAVWGNAAVKGNIGGFVDAEGNVSCGIVGGNLSAGDSVECGNVGGNLAAGDSVTCGNVGGTGNVGDSLTCADIAGSANSGYSIQCMAIYGNATAGENLSCCNVKGKLEANGDAATGNIGGDVYCGGDISCGDVEGAVKADGDVTCGDVGGSVEAGGDAKCDNVGGAVRAGCDVSCNNVGGPVKSDCDVQCNNVGGSVKSGGDVTCNNIEGSLCADGDVECNNISGDVHCGGDVECENIDGSAEVVGSLNADTIKASVTAGGEINAETISNCILNRQE